ncbi:MAG: hypothetical protein NTZ28_12500 [Nitrospirae bacterium]|nr:hypothetical protein [Nitrospirota bacterium]
MGLAKRKMHQIFLAALGDSVVGHSRIDKVPLEVDLRPPLPVMLRVYMYTATHPPGGRTLGEHKIQLIMPEHKDKLRANFDHSGGRIVLLVGYEPELLVFILWDAGLYKD